MGKIILLLCIVLLGEFLEQCERKNPRIFWTGIILLAITFSAFDEVQFQTPTIVEKNRASILAINPGGEGSKWESGTFVLETVFGKRKKYNLAFHRRLEQHFPDWKGRMDYQKKQEEFYKKAMKRKKEYKRIRVLDDRRLYSKEELDAINYFHGTGFYEKYQNPELKPNIFDTRQSFLLKMHNPVLRNNFLNSYNRKDY